MISGIIAEFNPFHNGHEYLLNKASENSDSVVVVMSQDIMQRGEFSSFNKWWRTSLALDNGADLVIGLPSIVSSQSAEFFSEQSIRYLDALGIDNLVFGSEDPDIKKINEVASTLNTEPEKYKVPLKNYLKSGMSFPKARMKALESYLDQDLKEFLTSSNNILSVEYAKGVEKINPNILLTPVKRQGADYNSARLDTEFASATGIRNALSNEKNVESLRLPYPSEELLNNFDKQDNEFIFKSVLLKLLTDKDNLKNIAGMNRGAKRFTKKLA